MSMEPFQAPTAAPLQCRYLLVLEYTSATLMQAKRHYTGEAWGFSYRLYLPYKLVCKQRRRVAHSHGPHLISFHCLLALLLYLDLPVANHHNHYSTSLSTSSLPPLRTVLTPLSPSPSIPSPSQFRFHRRDRCSHCFIRRRI